ncbi:translocation/assembly module TamB domain-containing protein [Wenyingzhuangia sp. chi5]|uniref:Translocation/assembly module TamB domain-containing protein n=1 Tax=Wenyingzhuangia gilva TaxID=3057677 RepID=A0ABT8VPR5_9FLAO|nr:translocation/assembly module TamB domain-containing protein [Wenyingzhuangia sp. chi5]MDO3693969.1 translocation/assembly module TamB domain-containing protein [Wenyingzhuangia sp. chi5]
MFKTIQQFLKKAIHFFKWMFLGLLVLFIALVLFIRSSWGQNIIKNKVTEFVAEKIETKFSIEKLYLSFSGNLIIEELYLEDQEKDTLLYSKELEVSVAILPIFTQNKINVKSVDWTGLKAKVYKPETTNEYNFDYIINAFVNPNTSEKSVQESNSSPLDIKVGTVNFADFDLLFNDEVLGVNTSLKLGSLGLKFGNKFNINTYRFPIEKLDLANVKVNYTQSKPFPETEESQEESPSPIIEIEKLSLENIKAFYQNKVDNQLADINLGLFTIKDALVDLAAQNIKIKKIGLNNTLADLSFFSNEKSMVQDTTKTTVSTKFEWPNWQVNVKELSFKNNSIALKTGNTITPKNVFNPENFKISKTNILLNDFSLAKNDLALDLKEISLIEKSGFHLKELALKGAINNQQIGISTLKIATNHSEIQTYGKIEYRSLDDFINQPKNTKFDVDISDLNLNIKDAYYFNQELKENEYVNKFSKHSITGKMKVKGDLKNLDIASLHLKWGAKTSVDLTAKIKNVLSENNLSFDLPNFRFKTDRKSMLSLIDEKEFGIIIPNSITLNSSTSGTLTNIKTNTVLKLPKGKIAINGTFKNVDSTQVKGTLKVTQLNVGNIINNDQMGLIDFETSLSAGWTDIHALNAELKTKFNSLQFDGYNYNPLEISAKIKQGAGQINTVYKDESLDFDTKTNVKLDSLTSSISSVITINGVNLQALKLTKENLKARLNINVDYKTNADGFKVKAQTDNGLLVYNEESFPISNFLINTNIAKDSTSVSVESGLLNLKMNANANPEKITTAINKHISTYFTKNKLDTVVGNTNLKAELTISQDPILDQVFLKGLNEFEPIKFDLSFKESEKKLVSSFNIPFIEYQGSSIKKGQFYLNSVAEKFDLDLKVDNVKYDPVNIQNINLQGKVVDEIVLLDFSTSDENEKIINIKTEIAANDSLVRFHINPENLILNRKNWEIPESNAILFNGNITSTDFELSRNNQILSFNAQVKEENNNSLAINFQHFDLLNLMAFLNPEENIASGIVGGNVEINHFNKEQNLVSDLKIEELNVFENLLGTLQLNAKTINNKNYDVNLSLQEKDNIDLVVEGSYNTLESASPLNLKVNLNKLSLSKIEAFGKEYISNASGSISANFNMDGKMEAPIYNGDLNFNNAKLEVNSFNTSFTFPEESIKIDNSSILLNKFTILDKDQNSFVLDGEIITSDFSNPKFNLSLNSENLQVLNSTIEDNDLYYGQLFLDADVKIGGDLNIPKVTGAIKINENTDFTYVIPESEIEAVEREGVVIFVNKKQTNDILTADGNSETSTGIVTGLDIKTVLKVDKSAILNVIIDKKTGDNLQISGAADLNFGMTPNGRTTLSGKYEVSSGHYEASLYNLVTRKFEIAKGSSILWQGDPLEAKMDISAIYKVKASASGLMSSVTSGMDAETLNKYRKKMPFWVYLNLNGELLKPEISFNLDVPEESRGELGGQVYTQVQQLNNREEDLNKQVFSLLVLGQFFPSNISDGSNGGSLSIARDNVNKALSNQLNNYSNKLVGKTGVELGFELDSYTDYTDKGEQNNTQLNVSAQKRLFNDRLTVQVGSGFEIENTSKDQNDKTPIIGNVNIEYALTENRRYRLKGFRKNEYQSVIDGQVIVTGIAFLFNREFNKFRELWQKENTQKTTEE